MPSTVIRQINYDPELKTLQIVFVTGLIYEYSFVPEEIYLELKNSKTKGIYFNDHIRNKYEFKRME